MKEHRPSGSTEKGTFVLTGPLRDSAVVRYAYYYQGQGREEYAMEKYAAFQAGAASPCFNCQGYCTGVCPHGLDIQTNMMQVHDLLTLA
jgi:predicted aldo/keto reductase-like oxidoreductase